jgi:hypothetical protein
MPLTNATGFDRTEDLLRTLGMIDTALSSKRPRIPQRVVELIRQTVTCHDGPQISHIYGLLLGGFTWSEACERLDASGPDT